MKVMNNIAYVRRAKSRRMAIRRIMLNMLAEVGLTGKVPVEQRLHRGGGVSTDGLKSTQTHKPASDGPLWKLSWCIWVGWLE